jgi:hypothetical protein
MLRLIKRLGVSLLAGGIALTAAYPVIFHLLWLDVAGDAPGDGQSGMGPVFGAAYLALAVGMFTSALLFRRSRAWW